MKSDNDDILEPEREWKFSCQTRYPDLPFVGVYSDIWDRKIVPQNRSSSPEEDTKNTLESSPLVIRGTSNPDYVIFVSQDLDSPSGSPFTVTVDPQHHKPQNQPTVVSIGHRRDLKDKGKYQTLWEIGKDETSED